MERAVAIARASLPVGHPSRILTLANLGAALTNTATTNSQRKVRTRVSHPVNGIAMISAIR